MKQLKHPSPILSRVSLALLLAGLLHVQASAADPEAKVREKLLESLTIELTPIRGEEVDEILLNPVFELKLEVLPDEEKTMRMQSSRRNLVFLADETLGRIVIPTSNQPLPYFNKLIDPEFQLTSESAPRFAAMLQALMPQNFFDDIDPAIVQIDDHSWHFYTGTFFDDLKAFVVTLNPDGNVTDVSYNLRIEDTR